VWLALGTASVVLVVLLWELARPRLSAVLSRRRLRRSVHERAAAPVGYDPGRERRAEQRARALLRSCVEEEDWLIYRDLGFLRVWGGLSERTAGGSAARNARSPAAPSADASVAAGAREATGPRRDAVPAGTQAPYAYLIYPHKPIVAYVPQTGALLNEYCVAFPDHSRPYGSARLPDSDDVLAKWIALTADERRLVADANMHLPGRQIDPEKVRRDLIRLARWERERSGLHADNVPAA
jgi:hypothetical protein